MAKLFVELDTETKDFVVKVNGEVITDVTSLDIYFCKSCDDYPGSCSFYVNKKEDSEDKKLSINTNYSAYGKDSNGKINFSEENLESMRKLFRFK